MGNVRAGSPATGCGGFSMDAVELLQRLIRFDTTNPPGNELGCQQFIRGLLEGAGLTVGFHAATPDRPNLLARLPGRGEAPPVLWYGHVDVVTTAQQTWTVPPFEGRLQDGMVWGRGALDMKGGVAMMLTAILRAAAAGFRPPGDLVLALVCDEETGGEKGAQFLADTHPGLFAGIRYAVGEFGGCTTMVGGQRFYPIQVAEKQMCGLRATVRGPAGHASIPAPGGTMARLGRFLQRIDARALPVHVTPVARRMLGTMAATIGGLPGLLLRQVLRPATTDLVLRLLGARGRDLFPLLRHTAVPTLLQGGLKYNVIPSEATVVLDGRILPGFAPADLLAEVRAVTGDLADLEVIRFQPGPPATDLAWFPTLAGILRELDPTGTPVPLMLSGATDARFLARLGIQTYGFLPMRLPPDFAFARVIHAADERIPVEALAFGVEALSRLLRHGPPR